jgi:excisionase family DNA binding protein
MDSLLTPDEVSNLLKIPKSWIYGRIHSRTLPFPLVKVGHYCRFPESGVKAFVEQATKTATSGESRSRDIRCASVCGTETYETEC